MRAKKKESTEELNTKTPEKKELSFWIPEVFYNAPPLLFSIVSYSKRHSEEQTRVIENTHAKKAFFTHSH